MIRIGKPYITVEDGRAKLCANLDIDGQSYELWFSVEEEYRVFLCDERSDAFVLGLLLYAMRYRHDIVCDTPMTDRLYYQLADQFLLPFYKLNGMSRSPQGKNGYSVKIACPIAPELEHPDNGHCIGTGISCGVDSIHVFATHKEITHACVWHAHVTTGIPEMDTLEAHTKAWEAMASRASAFSKDVGVKLIVGDTNFAQNCLPGLKWDGYTTFGNLFCIFALQKLWARYYVASDCDIMNFNMKIKSLDQDPARWEYFLFPHLALQNMSIYMDGQALFRVEKVKDIVGYAPSYKYLNVCHRINENHRNGTYDCPKCMRTLLDLEVFGAVDKYGEVFDIDYYKTHFHEFLAEYYRCLLHKDNFALELAPFLRRRRFGLRTRLKAWNIVLLKVLKKVIRLGRTQRGAFSSNG